MIDNKGFRLPKDFFNTNFLEKYSAAMIHHFSLVEITENDDFVDMLSEALTPNISGERLADIRQEQSLIEQVQDAAALVEIARKGVDILNRKTLFAKLLAQQEDTMPLLLKRYRTCSLDHFIENACFVFSKCEFSYVQTLRQQYEHIRYPYAQACACLTFAMRGMKEELEFLYREYRRFQRSFPGESYEQFPLLALYILCGKF